MPAIKAICLERARAFQTSDRLSVMAVVDTDVQLSRSAAGVHVAGSADRVAWTVDGCRVVVDDWKTGRQERPLNPGQSAVDPSAVYLQIGLYAWMLSGTGVEVIARHLHIGKDEGVICIDDLEQVDGFAQIVLTQMSDAIGSGRVIRPPWNPRA